MSRGKKLGILFLILVLLIAACFITVKLVQKKTLESADSSETVLQIDDTAITQLSWNYNGEELSFVRSEDTWTDAYDTSYPLDTSEIDALVTQISNLSSAKTIESPSDLSQYGLAEPVLTVNVTADQQYTVSFGNETKMGGQVYFTTGDGNVYVSPDTTTYSNFCTGRLDLLKKETLPDMSEIVSFTAEDAANPLYIEYDAESGRAYSDSYVWFGIDNGNTITLDTDSASTLVDTIRYLSWQSCVAYNVSQEDLANYGLDAPEAVVTINYKNADSGEVQSFVLKVGDRADTETCYAMIDGSNIVYTVSSTVLDTLLETTYSDMLPDEVLLMDWGSVKSMDIDIGGTTYTLVRETAETETDEESGSSITETVWTLNGQQVDLEDALGDLTSLTGTVDTSISGVQGNTAASFQIHRNTANSPEVSLVFTEYDDTYYAVTLNGTTNLLLSRETADEVLSEITEALSGVES